MQSDDARACFVLAFKKGADIGRLDIRVGAANAVAGLCVKVSSAHVVVSGEEVVTTSAL